ncbi:MAG TPA: hypothetical protein VGO93_07760 [Candidatus Xenobia bacterium]|jgi:hypothetical protein
MHRRHILEGLAGQVGEYLFLHDHGGGRWQVRVQEGRPQIVQPLHWQQFNDAMAYAMSAQSRPEYVALANRHHTTPFKVATADFLHSPQITQIDLTGYHGHAGENIHIETDDDMMLTQVGVLIVDNQNNLIEMGMAEPAEQGWNYRTTRQAHCEHVRVIVDASDLPGHLSERRIEKAI